MRFGIWTARWQLAGPRRALLFTGFAWLIIAVIVLRFTLASATTDVLAFLVAAVVGFLAHDVAGRTEQGARAAAGAAGPAAEADRMRAALLAAVSHDLRSPLAAAAAAVSCLRSPDLQLMAADQDELLATAEESLDLVSRLAATLLDVTRLQAGVRSVFPRPADLEEIITRSLAGPGPSGRSVRVDLPPGLPKVVADPPVMERAIANLTANALRYSPAGSPPLLTASACSGRFELRVIDCGPGVPEADRDRMFAPFQRLGDTSSTTGVGLGPICRAAGLRDWIVKHVTGSSRDRDHPWNFRICACQQGESRSWRQRRRQASVEPWPQAGSVPERGVLSKSHISPGNLNRRLRIEAMYFL